MSAKPPRPNLRDALSNWQQSDMAFFTKLTKAMRNYSRRFAVPPRNCCGNFDEPGCCIACEVPDQESGVGSNDTDKS